MSTTKKLPFDPANYRRPASRLDEKVKFQQHSSFLIGGAYDGSRRSETQTAYGQAPHIDSKAQQQIRMSAHAAKANWRSHSFAIGDETRYPSLCTPLVSAPDDEDAFANEVQTRLDGTSSSSLPTTSPSPSSPSPAPGHTASKFPQPVSRDIGLSDKQSILALKRQQYPKDFKGDYTLTVDEDPLHAHHASERLYLRHNLRAHHFDIGANPSSAAYMARMRTQKPAPPPAEAAAAAKALLHGPSRFATTHNLSYNMHAAHPQPGPPRVPASTHTQRSLHSPVGTLPTEVDLPLVSSSTSTSASASVPTVPMDAQTTTEVSYALRQQPHPDNRRGYNCSWKIHRPPVYSEAQAQQYTTHQQRRDAKHAHAPVTVARAPRGPVETLGANNKAGRGLLSDAPQGLQHSDAGLYFGRNLEDEANTQTASAATTETNDRATPTASAESRNGLNAASRWKSVTQGSYAGAQADMNALRAQRNQARMLTSQHRHQSHISLGTDTTGSERFVSETKESFPRPAMQPPRRDWRAHHQRTVLADHAYTATPDPDRWRTSALRYD